MFTPPKPYMRDDDETFKKLYAVEPSCAWQSEQPNSIDATMANILRVGFINISIYLIFVVPIILYI
jgi:hypothetical protein